MNSIVNEKILIVDHDEPGYSFLSSQLESFGYSLLPVCSNLEMVRQTVSVGKVAIAIIKVNLEKEWEGLEIAKWIYQRKKYSLF